MKYSKEMYLDCNFYDGGMGDEYVECYTQKIVKCKKPHKCTGGCDSEIQPGEYALRENGFLDGSPVSCYTCLPCIDKWLEESGQICGFCDNSPNCDNLPTDCSQFKRFNVLVDNKAAAAALKEQEANDGKQ